MMIADKASFDGTPSQVEEENGWFTMAIRPARLPFRVTLSSWAVAIIPGCLIGIYTAIQAPRSGGLFLVTGILAWLISGWIVNRLYASYHNARRRVQGPFQVSALGLRTSDGTLIPLGEVDGIHLGNAMAGRSALVGGFGIAAGAAQMGAAAMDRIATVSYTTEVEHRGKITVLAGGLSQVQARAVCLEVKRRLAM
jgi:hypothetical protein